MDRPETMVVRQQAPAVVDPATPSPVRERRRRTVRSGLLRLLLAVVLIGAWQFVSGRLIAEFWISSPSQVWTSLVNLAKSGALGPDIGITIVEMLLGLVFGIVAGIAVGVLFGLSESVANVLQPFVQGLYAIPKIAVAPLLILWFGIGLPSKVVLVTIVVFFLLFWNTYAGVRAVDSELINVVRVMGANRLYTITHVVLPSALGSVFTGIKVAIPQALVGAVVGEIIASNRGVGYFIQFSSSQFDTAGVFAGLFILMVLAAITDFSARRMELVLMRWNRR